MSKISNWLRYMRTTQERRRWFADAGDVHIRLKRTPSNLPTAWNDFWRRSQRSWKAHRKFRWRA